MNSALYAQPISSHGAKQALARLIAQICLLAAAVDIGYFIFFIWVGSFWMTWINVISVALYGLAYWQVHRHHLRVAVFLIWFEAFPHAVIGALLLGWGSGFQYLLLMFVPAIVISSRRRMGALFILAMLAFLFSLRIVTYQLGPLAPIQPFYLELLSWSNFTLFVVMFSWTADYYRRQLVKAEARLHALATTDDLTRLSNRRHFTELAETLLSQARRSQSPCCLAILDIDHFKAINDSEGHEVGDRVLQAVARTIAATIRDSDVLARWGGEEFVVFMADTDIVGAEALSERIRMQVEATQIEGKRGPLTRTISIGVATVHPATSLEDALSRADQALYRSKAEGRNRTTRAN